MKTNLIIVEGLPGSGKSTTASMIAEQLSKKGKKVICFDEGTKEHPADYFDYNFSSFEQEKKLILEKWNSFVNNYDENTIYIFNCIFLQNPMSETMMKFGLSYNDSLDYISRISEIIKPLNPIIIYIDELNVKSSIDKVVEERGNDWLDYVVEYHTSQGYGKQNNLIGYLGYIECLEERKKRELNILKSIDLDSYIISQDIKVSEFAQLYKSVGWSCPCDEQIKVALTNSELSIIVRNKNNAVATISLLGDHGMHWFVKDFIVNKNYQGKMIGTLLYHFCENYVKSTLKENWKVCIDLRSSKGKENFYESLGFKKMPDDFLGNGMEKILKK